MDECYFKPEKLFHNYLEHEKMSIYYLEGEICVSQLFITL